MKTFVKKLSMIIVMMAFAVIVAMIVPTKAQAAAFKGNSAGKVTKCGSYYIKRNKTGIYKSKKKTSGFKLVVKAATSTAKDNGSYAYGFTSNGSTIYYAVNDNKTNKGIIYSIKVTGKSKKTIYKAKHQVNVYYAYDGKLIYKSDVHGQKNFFEDYFYQLNPSSKTKYKLIAHANQGWDSDITTFDYLDLDSTSGKYVVFKVDDEQIGYLLWDMSKQKSDTFAYLDDCSRLKTGLKPYILKDGYVYYINESEAWDEEDDDNNQFTVLKRKLFATSNQYLADVKGFRKITSFSTSKVVYTDAKGNKKTISY